jgi:hypothetical protein
MAVSRQKIAGILLTTLCARAADFPAASDHVATLWIELLAATAASSFPQIGIISRNSAKNPILSYKNSINRSKRKMLQRNIRCHRVVK